MSALEVAPEVDWEPGDPLYSRAQHPNSLYLFNFREQPLGDNCTCGDAASWPTPRGHQRIVEDPLADFIAHHHATSNRRSTP